VGFNGRKDIPLGPDDRPLSAALWSRV